jgi:hypothetical protein
MMYIAIIMPTSSYFLHFNLYYYLFLLYVFTIFYYFLIESTFCFEFADSQFMGKIFPLRKSTWELKYAAPREMRQETRIVRIHRILGEMRQETRIFRIHGIPKPHAKALLHFQALPW